MTGIAITIEQKIREVSARFEQAHLTFGHGTENAWDEAAWLVLGVLGISPQMEQLDADIPVSLEQAQRIRDLVERRIQMRKPLAYLLNSAWFCGLEFYIDERVIVPRSPIAELIANDFAPWLKKTPQTILDLCTGSGCIAVACALQFPLARVTATDISDEALSVAKINVNRHALEDQLQLYKADVFTGLPPCQYDLIVCNPPYVDAEEMAVLSPEYQQEPGLALAAGHDGLDFVRRMLNEVGNFLTPDGVLVCEVGNSEVALTQAYPYMPFVWQEFEQGGYGVFILTRSDLTDIGINKTVE
ncbi:MAG: 50S ribosomal protein L3 N(5)-glutamine methyltransferase [Gammaproteobacteria bacterium]|nr:50S ribosomal protein L3 N(5)-glutamine methyltransferase [Gammaproteobacteria bacterium]